MCILFHSDELCMANVYDPTKKATYFSTSLKVLNFCREFQILQFFLRFCSIPDKFMKENCNCESLCLKQKERESDGTFKKHFFTLFTLLSPDQQIQIHCPIKFLWIVPLFFQWEFLFVDIYTTIFFRSGPMCFIYRPYKMYTNYIVLPELFGKMDNLLLRL